MADLMAGRVDYVCNIASTVGAAIEGKQVKAIATLHARALADPARSADRARAGPRGLRCLYLERGVPAEGHAAGAGDKLNAALVEVMDNPAFRERASRASA